MKIVQPSPERKSFPTRGIQATTQIHMQEKRQRDSELWDNQDSSLWIVQNKLYDLKNFVHKHPGGSSWLLLTQGQDITEHFIVHHLRQQKARDILKEYYVGECKKKNVRFTFQKDGLYRRVKEKVLKKFTIQELKDQTQSKNFAVVFLTLFALSLLGTLAFHSYLCAFACSFLLLGVMGIGHNFVHHKQNLYQYYFLLAGFTHKQWKIMHCLSHHLYPNLEIDYEAAAFQPISYFLRTMPQNHILVEPVLQVIYFFLQPVNMMLKIVIVPLIKQKKPDLWYGFPIIILIMLYLSTGSITQSLKLYLTIYGFFGLMLGRSLFCGHRLQELWTEGAEKIDDFGQHTIRSSNDTDVGVQGLFSYALASGLNIHTPHHFFPTADHAILPSILDIIQSTCIQMNIKFHQTSRLNCFKSLSKGLIKKAPWQKF